jgi:hypothetical protein
VRRLTRAKTGASISALLLFVASYATGAVVQTEGVRITVLSQVQPYKLPRKGTAPIAVFVSGHLATPNGEIPPQLNELTVQVNRHGLLQSKGLPTCPVHRIQPSSTDRALRVCGDALIGSGQFWANIVLAGQAPYPTRGRLLIFNGRKNGKPALFAHIFTQNPFNASFVIVFAISKIHKGTYGTQLKAAFPQALGSWGYVDRIKLTLKRKYHYLGKALSYFNAGCPAPEGSKRTVFPLAYVSFAFAGRPDIGKAIPKTCGVKGG